MLEEVTCLASRGVLFFPVFLETIVPFDGDEFPFNNSFSSIILRTGNEEEKELIWHAPERLLRVEEAK